MSKIEMVDVLYIHPTKKLGSLVYSIAPTGAFLLMNLIRSEYNVKGINYGVEKSIRYHYDLEEELKKISYKVLLIDLHWYEHSFGALEIAALSKKLYNEVPVIIGGFTSTIYSKEILTDFHVVDYILKGDSEVPFHLLIDYLVKGIGNVSSIPNLGYRDNGVVIDKEITYCCSNIDDYDYVSVDFMKHPECCYYTTTGGIKEKKASSYWLCIARGCIFNCSYCCGSRVNLRKLYGRNHMICRSVEKVVSDMQRLVDTGVKVICPTHDFEMFGEKYYHELFEKIRQLNLDVGIYLECFQLPSKDFIDDFCNTFNQKLSIIVISPLCGNDKLRKENGKVFDNIELFEALTHMAKRRVILDLYYSLNLPGEKKEDFEVTCDQIKQVLDCYPSELLTLYYQRVALDPLAPMREKPFSVKSNMNTFMDYYNYCASGNENYTGYDDYGTQTLTYKIEKYDDIRQKLKKEGREKNKNYILV